MRAVACGGAMLTLLILAACAKKQLPEAKVKGFARFQLNGGATISQASSDEYNPYVIQMGNNYLVLVFGSNRACGTCTGHNLFVARSVGPYNNDAVFPAFENPTVLTIGGTPLNYTNRIQYGATATGNNVRIFLTNTGGNVQQTAAIVPTGPYDTTLTNIANVAGLSSTVLGVEITGNRLYARQGGTVYSINHASAGDPLVAMATGQTATSVANLDGAFTSRSDGFFSLIDGTITSMSLYGNGGNLVVVNNAIAKGRITPRQITVMGGLGGGFNGALMFVSGVEFGGSSEDMYVVDGLTVWEMWQQVNPKPPGAPNTGAAETATAAPAYSPTAGHYGMPISVTMTSTTTGTTICYTTDGATDPVCSATATCTTGNTYTAAVSVTYTTTNFRARACKVGRTDSAVVSATHVSDGTQPSTPGSPNADGTSSSQVQVQWAQSTDNATAQAQLVYEICQTTINNGCNTFTATFTSSAGATSYNSNGLSASTTYYYRIRSRDLAGNTSGYTAQVSATTAAGPTVNAPTFSPVAGTYNTTQNVTISTTTGSATICYTTDGVTNPVCDATPTCTTGTTYSGAVAISATQQLRAIGCRNGYTSSTVTSGTYTIDSVAPVISATAPASSATVSNTQVSFTFSEACASGNVTWTRTGGSADGSSPHVRSLVGSELTSGAHNNITLTNNPTLVSGAIYSIAFNCTDAAGNAATTVTNTSVTYNAVSVAWTLRSMSASTTWSSIAYGNGMYIATRTGNAAASSPDGINWTARTMPSLQTWSASTHGNGTFVAISNGPSNGAATSTDGINWTARTLPATANWAAVTYASGQFVAVADASTTAATSPDGINWTLRTLPVSRSWKSITYGNGKYVIVGTNSTVALYSGDGINWNQGTIPTSGWASVAYGGGKFVAVGNGALTATSADGNTWTSNAVTNRVWASVVFASGTFVMISSGGQFGSSTNGTTWQEATMPTASTWVGATYGIGQVVAVANSSIDAATAPIADTMAPEISAVGPVNGVTVSDAKVSYTLSEPCGSGSVTWTRTGGTADPGSPRVQALAGVELTLGVHNNITLINNPSLVSGAIYSVAFNCTDASSNTATTVTSTNVTYDPTAAGWYTFLGGSSSDLGYSVQQTSDGGYIAAGYAGGNIATLGGQTPLNAYSASNDFLVIKLTSAGAVSWYTMLGGTGVDPAYSIQQTSDGGYIVAGSASVNIATLGGQTPIIGYGGGGSDALIIKLTSAGAVSWYTFLGGTGTDAAFSVKQTSDSGYAVIGYSFFNIPTLGGQTPLNAWTSGQDFLVVKMTSAGAVSWYTFLGSTGTDSGNAIYQTADSGYIVSGSAGANIATLGGQTPLNSYSFSQDMLVVKLTAAGAVSWYTFLGGSGGDIATAVHQTADGGYIIGGYSGANIASLGGQTPLNAFSANIDFMVIKLTSVGAVSWYTFIGSSANDFGYAIQQTSDGGYVIGGEASANIATLSGQTPVLGYFGSGTDGLVVKLSAAGAISWFTFLGGSGTDSVRSIFQTTNGGYAVLGQAGANIGTLGGFTPLNAFSANSECFLIRLKSDGTM